MGFCAVHPAIRSLLNNQFCFRKFFLVALSSYNIMEKPETSAESLNVEFTF